MAGKCALFVNFCSNICLIQEKSVTSRRFSQTKGD